MVLLHIKASFGYKEYIFCEGYTSHEKSTLEQPLIIYLEFIIESGGSTTPHFPQVLLEASINV